MQGFIPSLLSGNPSSTAVFEALRAELETRGVFEIEEKKTSLHIKNSRAAFLGVHPRKQGLRLNIVTATRIESGRVVKAEQVSANRWHNEIDVREAAEVDSELMGWIAHAYAR